MNQASNLRKLKIKGFEPVGEESQGFKSRVPVRKKIISSKKYCNITEAID